MEAIIKSYKNLEIKEDNFSKLIEDISLKII
jgi:hypothetical protein